MGPLDAGTAEGANWDSLPEQVEAQDIPSWHLAELAARRARAMEHPGVGKPWWEVLARIEKMPELHGKVWEDVRAARRPSVA